VYLGRAESLLALCAEAEAMTTTDADHLHAFELWATFHRAPAGEPPAHTSFMVFTCACGVYRLFPRSNFALCTDAFHAQFRAAAAAAGWHDEEAS